MEAASVAVALRHTVHIVGLFIVVFFLLSIVAFGREVRVVNDTAPERA